MKKLILNHITSNKRFSSQLITKEVNKSGNFCFTEEPNPSISATVNSNCCPTMIVVSKVFITEHTLLRLKCLFG